jgi:CRP-like cAMP-binding protein
MALDTADLDKVNCSPLFAHLGEDVARAVIGDREPKSYDRGRSIFLQGDPADAFFLVLDGWVKLFRAMPDGGEAVVAVMAPGESFAEAVMFMGGRYPVAAEAVTDCRLLRVEARAVRAAMQADPRVASALLASIAHHTETLSDQVEHMKVLGAPQRVAEFLVRTARVRAGAASLTLPYDKALIARRLGMTPESFSRALAILRDHGVQVERDAVDIANVARLRSFVRDTADRP